MYRKLSHVQLELFNMSFCIVCYTYHFFSICEVC